jgi:hypothetical protein
VAGTVYYVMYGFLIAIGAAAVISIALVFGCLGTKTENF